MADEARVSVVDADGKKTYFEGTEEDAEAFIEANFPRIHVEPGVNYGDDGPQPDAYLMLPDGSYSWYDGTDWYTEKPEKAGAK